MKLWHAVLGIIFELRWCFDNTFVDIIQIYTDIISSICCIDVLILLFFFYNFKITYVVSRWNCASTELWSCGKMILLCNFCSFEQLVFWKLFEYSKMISQQFPKNRNSKKKIREIFSTNLEKNLRYVGHDFLLFWALHCFLYRFIMYANLLLA